MPPDPKPYRNIGPQPGSAPQVEANPYAQFVTPPAAAAANPYAQFVTQAPPEAAPAWSDVPLEAAANIIPSTGRLIADTATGLYNAVRHPIDTTMAVGGLLNALGSKISRPGNLVREQDAPPTQEQLAERARVEAPADAIGKHYGERYGSSEGFRTALAKDPASVMMDLATVLSGGSLTLAKAPGLVGMAGRGMGTAASYIDPLSLAGKAAIATRNGLGYAAAGGAGMLSGRNPMAYVESYKAGEKGGDAYATLVGNRNGSIPVDAVINDMKSAVSTAKDVRQAEYLAGIRGTQQDGRLLDVTPIAQYADDLVPSLRTPGGLPKASDTAVKSAESVRDEIARHLGATIGPDGSLIGHNAQTAIELAGLKQRLQGIAGENKMNPEASRIPTAVADRVRDTIIKQVPEYGRVMDAYSGTSNLLKDIEFSLGLGKNAQVDTAVRKAGAVMRRDASSGTRTQNAAELAQMGPAGERIMPALAGQATHPKLPDNFAKMTATTLLGTGAVAVNPWLVALAPFASPRVSGATAGYYGRLVGGARKAGDKIGLTGDRARIAGEGMNVANDGLVEALRQYNERRGAN